MDTKRETSPEKDEHKDDEDYEENSDAEFGSLRAPCILTLLLTFVNFVQNFHETSIPNG